MEKAKSVIRQHRSKLGLSQPALAKLLDVSTGTIRNWELHNTSPNVKQLVMISLKLDVTLDELMYDYNNIEGK